MKLDQKLLSEAEKKVLEIEKIDLELSKPNLSQEKMISLSKKRSKLENLKNFLNEQRILTKKISESEEIISSGMDEKFVSLASAEISELKPKLAQIETKILKFLFPNEDSDEVDKIVLEIRAGAGGEEAGLFAEELMQMYLKFSDQMGFRAEFANLQRNQTCGIKEAIILISGEDVFSKLKFESGVHRVQRVPATESSGRIHTSTVTVAVLPESKEVENIKLKPEEVRVDVFRSSGPGGQSVNTTDSAVRLTHLPTGITVSCQDEKSQIRNKEKAFRILKSRILQQIKEEQEAKESFARKSQIGTGERNEKIRTYNFPQNRITDHRIKFSTNNLHEFLAGNINEIIEELENFELQKKIKNLNINQI